KDRKDLVLWDRSTRHLRRLTDPRRECMAPALSFDDRLIAYSCQVNGSWDIYLLDPFGKGESIRVTQGPGRSLAPRFGSDGSLVSASDRTGRFQLYRIRATAMVARRFTAELLVGRDADLYAPSASGDVTWSQEQLPAMPAPARSSLGAVRIGRRIY